MPSSKDVLGTSAASPYDDASAARYTQKKTDTGNGGALRRSCRRARSDGPSRNGRGGSAEEEGGRDSRDADTSESVDVHLPPRAKARCNYIVSPCERQQGTTLNLRIFNSRP